MPTVNQLKSLTGKGRVLKSKQNMGHSPNKAQQNAMSSPNGLYNGIISSWLTSSASRICSHQQVDDHRKSRKPTYKTIKQANRVS